MGATLRLPPALQSFSFLDPGEVCQCPAYSWPCQECDKASWAVPWNPALSRSKICSGGHDLRAFTRPVPLGGTLLSHITTRLKCYSLHSPRLKVHSHTLNSSSICPKAYTPPTAPRDLFLPFVPCPATPPQRALHRGKDITESVHCPQGLTANTVSTMYRPHSTPSHPVGKEEMAEGQSRF